MTPPPSSNNPADQTAPPSAPPPQPSGAVLILLFVVVLAFVFLFLLVFRNTPHEFLLEVPNADSRHALLQEIRREIDAFRPGDPPTGIESYWKRDVYLIAERVQSYAIEHGELPKTLGNMGFEDGDLTPRVKYAAGGNYWRVYGPNGHVIARGN
jgi:hypothetical protein